MYSPLARPNSGSVNAGRLVVLSLTLFFTQRRATHSSRHGTNRSIIGNDYLTGEMQNCTRCLFHAVLEWPRSICPIAASSHGQPPLVDTGWLLSDCVPDRLFKFSTYLTDSCSREICIGVEPCHAKGVQVLSSGPMTDRRAVVVVNLKSYRNLKSELHVVCSVAACFRRPLGASLSFGPASRERFIGFSPAD